MSHYGLRTEADYYPNPRTRPGDIMWVFLRDVKVGDDGVLTATYQPAYDGAQWETMPAREFRRNYLRMHDYQHAYFTPAPHSLARPVR